VVKGNPHRMFEFKDFTQAFGFMKRVALAADRMDHHPDWSNAYNKVTMDLSTNSAGGITENDFELASNRRGQRQSRNGTCQFIQLFGVPSFWVCYLI
jgi:4a-hydroxytetrahydrobiopterin dehydratase